MDESILLKLSEKKGELKEYLEKFSLLRRSL